MEKWLDEPSILLGLRRLTVTDAEKESNERPVPNPSNINTFDTEHLEALVRLIANLGNLRQLTWNSEHFCISKAVLHILKKHHPKAVLKINAWHCISTSSNGTFEALAEYLSTYDALVALRSRILSGAAQYSIKDTREQTFRRIVSTAPHLKQASILVLNTPGTYHRGTYPYPAWREDNFPKHYKHTYPNPSLKLLSLDGYPITKATLDDWGRFVDLSQLEEFKCTRGFVDPSYFRVAPSVLVNLKHVSLNLASHLYAHSNFSESVEEFIKCCNPLETLSLWSWSRIVTLDTILERHGQTLKALQLHERELPYVAIRRRLLNVKDIQKIRESSPQLEELTIDIDRRDQGLDLKGEAKNIRIYKEIAKFGNHFGRLQLYFDLGVVSFVERESDEEFFEESEDDEAGHSSGSDSEAADGDEDAAAADVESQNRDCNPQDSSAPGVRTKRTTRSPHVSFPPSSHSQIESYLTFIWRTVFGNRTPNTGPRSVDAKFGEWERKFGGAYGVGVSWLEDEERLKTCWAVRAGERDDGLDAGDLGCVVRQVARGKGGLAWS